MATMGNTQVPDAGQLISSLSLGDDELPLFEPVEARGIDADVSRSQSCSYSSKSSKWHFSCASVDVARPPGAAEAVRFLDAGGLDCQEDVAVVQYGQSAIPEDLGSLVKLPALSASASEESLRSFASQASVALRCVDFAIRHTRARNLALRQENDQLDGRCVALQHQLSLVANGADEGNPNASVDFFSDKSQAAELLRRCSVHHRAATELKQRLATQRDQYEHALATMQKELDHVCRQIMQQKISWEGRVRHAEEQALEAVKLIEQHRDAQTKAENALEETKRHLQMQEHDCFAAHELIKTLKARLSKNEELLGVEQQNVSSLSQNASRVERELFRAETKIRELVDENHNLLNGGSAPWSESNKNYQETLLRVKKEAKEQQDSLLRELQRVKLELAATSRGPQVVDGSVATTTLPAVTAPLACGPCLAAATQTSVPLRDAASNTQVTEANTISTQTPSPPSAEDDVRLRQVLAQYQQEFQRVIDEMEMRAVSDMNRMKTGHRMELYKLKEALEHEKGRSAELPTEHKASNTEDGMVSANWEAESEARHEKAMKEVLASKAAEHAEIVQALKSGHANALKELAAQGANEKDAALEDARQTHEQTVRHLRATHLKEIGIYVAKAKAGLRAEFKGVTENLESVYQEKISMECRLLRTKLESGHLEETSKLKKEIRSLNKRLVDETKRVAKLRRSQGDRLVQGGGTASTKRLKNHSSREDMFGDKQLGSNERLRRRLRDATVRLEKLEDLKKQLVTEQRVGVAKEELRAEEIKKLQTNFARASASKIQDLKNELDRVKAINAQYGEQLRQSMPLASNAEVVEDRDLQNKFDFVRRKLREKEIEVDALKEEMAQVTTSKTMTPMRRTETIPVLTEHAGGHTTPRKVTPLVGRSSAPTPGGGKYLYPEMLSPEDTNKLLQNVMRRSLTRFPHSDDGVSSKDNVEESKDRTNMSTDVGASETAAAGKDETSVASAPSAMSRLVSFEERLKRLGLRKPESPLLKEREDNCVGFRVQNIDTVAISRRASTRYKDDELQ